MYCPQCGTESSSGQQYCRSCGANLKVIGKAVTLSEAIARSDRGPLPKIKEMMKNLKVEHVTEDVSNALDQMNKEIARSSHDRGSHEPWWMHLKHPKTPEQRRENNLVTGTVSLFSGIGLMIFLYYLSAALVLRLPPDVIAKIPFEIEPVVRVIWLIGLLPVLSGVGHIVAGLLIRPSSTASLPPPGQQQETMAREYRPPTLPGSVTEQTTNLLDQGRNPNQ